MATIVFDDIRPLYGLRLDSSAVEAFLVRFPEHRIDKPSDGAQYVLFKPLGFDLLFIPPSGLQGGRSKHLRVLREVFLFRQGEEKHREFPQPPFGLAFSDTRDELVRKLGEPFASSLTVGLGKLSWEKWRVEDLIVHAMYHLDTMTTRTFTIGPE
jgi:hypothetical protein